MSRILGTFPTDSPEWHAARAGRIGGSSIASVMGWSPFETREQLAAKMLGQVEPKRASRAMNRGNFLESGVAEWLAADKGLTYDEAASVATYQHDEFDWATYNPDRITIGGELVEIKTVGDRTTDAGWGRAGTDKVPLHYAAQITWGMGILGLDSCWLAVLAGGTNGRPSLDMAVYRIKFNADNYQALLIRAERFITNLTERHAA
ncbi:MAG: YqaJ viral recombinase family protein [Chitinophagaceae bacterium]|nr:YqaJ viral recombinase family protein [Rubrivivax sp.]